MSPFVYNLAAALAIFGTSASAHMILANPVPYGKSVINNSPLSSSGSNFPCQVTSDAASFYSTDGISNSATAGDTIKMSFTGSAVHGGGSCQVALSTDMQPSQSTRWSVILSIEGGCPTKDGTTAGTYDVKIPSDIPAGTYSYAWTWTSEMSGTQEYYMNCAPITIKAASGSTKRSQNIRARSDALDNYPPLAVYNMADLNTCKSTLSSDPIYPFPGDTVEHLLSTETTGIKNGVKISGTDCFAKGVTYSGSSGSSSSSSDTSSSDTASATAEASSSAAATASAVASGGVFATSSVSAAAATATGSSSSSSSSSGSSSGSDTGSDTGSSGSSASTTGSSTGATSTGSASSSSGGTCTLGTYKCSSAGTAYQMCEAAGTWSVSMAMASGTECTPGTSTALTISASSSTKKRAAFRVF